MSDQTDEVVNIEFDADDKISPKLGKMEKAVLKVGSAVDRASSRFSGMAASFLGLAGFFALGPAIQGAQNYIDHLDKMSDLTGIAADRVGGISNALEDAGVSMEGVDAVMSKLVKKTAQAGEGNKALAKMAKRYGVALKDGPESTLLAISGLMEKGKLNAGQMQRILGVSSSAAADMADAMSMGPEALAKKIEEATKKNAAFNDSAMNGMQAYKNATASIHTSWNRLTASIMIKLAPSMTKLAEKFEHSIDGWAAGAEKFGNFLVKHMDKLIAMAKTYAKIMTVNTIVQKIPGLGGKGIGGLASSAFNAVSARLAASGASGLAKLLPLGGFIMVIVSAVKALGENFNGITDRLKKTFGGVLETIGRIGGKIASIFSGDGPLGKFLGGVGYAFLEVVNKIGQVMGFILNMVEKIIDLIPDIFKGASIADRANEAIEYKQQAMKMLKNKNDQAAIDRINQRANQILQGKYNWGVDKTVTAKAPAVPDAAKLKNKNNPDVYQDFRGSRFDITQAFSDGYDPDRVAVVFSNDIASLGEKKLQSGFAPLFSVR